MQAGRWGSSGTCEAVLIALMAGVMRFGQEDCLSKVQAPRGRMPSITTCMLGAILLMYATMCRILQNERPHDLSCAATTIQCALCRLDEQYRLPNSIKCEVCLEDTVQGKGK